MSDEASEYLEHVTTDGERWDQLADRYYGDPYGYERLVVANRHVPPTPVLVGGLVLRVPVVVDADTIAADQLPPWKR